MDSEDADPDPGGVIHPTLFYGLWPRFIEEEEEDRPAAEPVVGLAE